jgi:hypothetical protein
MRRTDKGSRDGAPCEGDVACVLSTRDSFDLIFEKSDMRVELSEMSIVGRYDLSGRDIVYSLPPTFRVRWRCWDFVNDKVTSASKFPISLKSFTIRISKCSNPIPSVGGVTKTTCL